MSFEVPETYLIPLPSTCRSQRSPAIRFRIGAAVVEGSAIEFWDGQGTIYKDNSHKGQRFPEFDAR